MEVVRAKTCIGSDGQLRLDIPTALNGREVEMCVILNTLPKIDEPVVDTHRG